MGLIQKEINLTREKVEIARVIKPHSAARQTESSPTDSAGQVKFENIAVAVAEQLRRMNRNFTNFNYALRKVGAYEKDFYELARDA